MKDYDKDKFVVLVSAGPTARKVKYSNNYYTCGVNVTPKLIERTDFWIMNDACYFQDFSKDDYNKISNMVIPQFPHTVNGYNFHPNKDCDYRKVTEHLPKHIKVHAFNIQSSKKFNLPIDLKYPFFEARSSNESAIRWLLYNGFKKFISLGHDPEGEYHTDMFTRPTLGGGSKVIHETIDNLRYSNVNKRIKMAVKEHNCLFIRLVLPPDCVFDETHLKECLYLENNTGYFNIEVSNEFK